ncbi:hypothetical protein EF911_33390 [Streptomyces sp. WAC06128]|nr:hypothetical protein EF911_33390 [Streptomyces sp. WAC06128]
MPALAPHRRPGGGRRPAPDQDDARAQGVVLVAGRGPVDRVPAAVPVGVVGGQVADDVPVRLPLRRFGHWTSYRLSREW